MVITLGLFIIIAGIVFGLLGIFMARNKSVSDLVGFGFGALLGPVGLIIIGLLNPTKAFFGQQAHRDEDFRGQRVLASDAYRLWLVHRYAVQRHDVLGSYVCDHQLFDTVDEALEHASLLDLDVPRSY